MSLKAGPNQSTGWDGQFYYLLSLDPFMQKNNFQSGIDLPSYRYQRIGLALTANVASNLLGQDQPSPQLYWLINYLSFILGLVLLSQLFFRFQVPQSFLWLWGFGVGTQSVLFHGLPDAFADSLFIISFYLMTSEAWFFSALVGSLCVLARESFASAYGMLFGFYVLFKVFGAKVHSYHRDYLKGLSPLLIILPFLIESSLSAPGPRLRKVFLIFMVLQPVLFGVMKYRERHYQLQCPTLLKDTMLKN
jgi:hypothetical protein